MTIDYSVPEYSKYYLNMDSNYRYGYRHLYMVATSVFLKKNLNVEILTLSEKIYHIVLGIFEFIPLFGNLIALIDKSLNSRQIRVIKLKEKDPYKQGVEQGKALKKEIHFCLEKGVKIFESFLRSQGKDPLEEAKKLEPYIPEEYKEEMRGIAEGSELSYDQILIANTILDIAPLFGCSLYATMKEEDGNNQSIVATNYFHSKPRSECPNVDNSFSRFDAIEKGRFAPTIEECKQALKVANYYDSVQSIVFDPNTKDIHIAIAGQYSANRKFTHLRANEIFDNPAHETTAKVVKLARNLDWPLPMLGPQSVVVVRPENGKKKSTAIVGWPGLLGALSGMNESGVAVSISVVPSKVQQGIPNQFLFRKILEDAQTINEVTQKVQSHQAASPMNLMAVATDGIAKFELDPARQKKGFAFREAYA